MMKPLVLCVLAAITTGFGLRPDVRDRADVVNTGLLSDSGAPTSDPGPSCAQVSFTRSLRYGEFDRNMLDVATMSAKDTTPRPVLLIIAGETFTGDGGDAEASTSALQDEAMCFAARQGMVGVRMSYRLAPAAPWPAGAKDVAAAAAWIHQNIDLFGGNAQEIIAIGYAVGAFHVASFLAHPEFQPQDSDLAGAVLVSGIYKSSVDGGDGERAYFGTDPSKYDERSALPGLLSVQLPLMLAWSVTDPPRLVTQGEMLKKLLCTSVAHCPRTRVLKTRLASGFGPDPSDSGLAQLTLELVQEIEARGLP
ncbi:MAG TPA: carboxylesterase family protein [Bradyrhizobium sp.]